MNLKNYYYYFQSALSPKICDEIVKYGKEHNPEMAITGGYSRDDKGDSYKVDGTLKKSAIKKILKFLEGPVLRRSIPSSQSFRVPILCLSQNLQIHDTDSLL